MFDLPSAWVSATWAFVDLIGREVPVSEVQLAWSGEGRRLDRATLEFDLDWATWQRVDREQLFHLLEERRGPIFAGSLIDGRTVHIEARLASDYLPLLAHPGVADILDAAAELLAAPPDSPLRATEAWYALNVSQERVPGLRVGFSTSWDSPG